MKAPTLFGKRGEPSLADGWQWVDGDVFVHVLPFGDGWQLLLSVNYYRAVTGEPRRTRRAAVNDAAHWLRKLKKQLERLGA